MYALSQRGTPTQIYRVRQHAQHLLPSVSIGMVSSELCRVYLVAVAAAAAAVRLRLRPRHEVSSARGSSQLCPAARPSEATCDSVGGGGLVAWEQGRGGDPDLRL